MADGPRFRPARGQDERGAPWSLVILLGVVSVLLLMRAYWPMPEGVPVLIEIAGDVPRPGTYALDEATVHAAITAAGGDASAVADRAVPPGHRVIVQGHAVRIERPSDPVLVALPVDPNTAARHELMAIPGIGAITADRIIEDRRERGPYRSFEDLRRVRGVRAQTLDQIEPFITLSDVDAVDLNHARAGELETLPGIGPVLAARIVIDRAENGAYASPDDLVRVSGIGPSLVRRLTPLVQVSP